MIALPVFLLVLGVRGDLDTALTGWRFPFKIAATLILDGKPLSMLRALKPGDGLKLLPVPYTEALEDDYLPAEISSEDYPGLVPEGAPTETVAVGAVLAAYNWPRNTDRHQRVARLVNALFNRLAEFQKQPRHPKWKEVSLSAPLADWQRLPYADQWLKSHNVEAFTRARFDEFLKQTPTAAATIRNDSDRESLFKQFQQWDAERNARAQVRPAPATASQR